MTDLDFFRFYDSYCDFFKTINTDALSYKKYVISDFSDFKNIVFWFFSVCINFVSSYLTEKRLTKYFQEKFAN